jgi:L-ascorbate metabolism protein UlaG (beta-lactamase superfamily)
VIAPLLADDAFLADVESTRGRDGLRLWWLGQSGFLLQAGDRHLLLDPYLSDSLTAKYADTDKPHVRMTARVVAPERLDFVEAATSSHNHTDHLDAGTLVPLLRANPRLSVVVPEANRAFAAARLGVEPGRLLGLDDGTSLDVAGFSIRGVPAAHDTVERDLRGRCHHLGYVVRGGGVTVYHSGDCVPFEGQAEILRPLGVDVALLPINGRAPERRVPGNFWGAEAAALAHAIGARLAIPCHYDMFVFNTATPDAFVAEARRLGLPYRVLQAGERWSSSARVV